MEALNESAELRAQMLQLYNETKSFESKIGVVIPSIFAFVVAVGLVGNLLVVMVALNRQMRNTTNTLIIGLACSDLMFLTLCVPFTAIDYALTVWIFPRWMCSMINYLQHSSAYFSVWTLTLMAGDRFLAVCYPVESISLRNASNTGIALAILYSVILISQIPVASIHGVYEYYFVVERRSTCAIVGIATGVATLQEARVYYFSFNFFGYLLPLGVTCVFYYLMLKRLWNAPVGKGRCRQGVAVPIRSDALKAKKKATRLVLCVVVIWAFCWLPLNICFLFSGIEYPGTLVKKGGKTMVILQISSQVLAYTNSCLNPILYAFLSDNFRQGFLRIFAIVLSPCVDKRHFAVKRGPLRYNPTSNAGMLSAQNSVHKCTRPPLRSDFVQKNSLENEGCELLQSEIEKTGESDRDASNRANLEACSDGSRPFRESPLRASLSFTVLPLSEFPAASHLYDGSF